MTCTEVQHFLAYSWTFTCSWTCNKVSLPRTFITGMYRYLAVLNILRSYLALSTVVLHVVVSGGVAVSTQVSGGSFHLLTGGNVAVG